MFLLRASEIEALQVKDVTFGEYDGTRYVRIFIRKPKTDQEELGAFRSLNGANKTLRPYSRLKSWFGRISPEDREGQVFGGGILGMVTRLIKWSVAVRNLPSDSFSIRSLRSGGATCLYRAGVDLEFIRRFGRWKSSAFSIYLHFEDKVLRKLPICLMESEGLMTQLKVCTDQGNKLEYARTGEWVRVTTKEPGGAESDGQPSSFPFDARRTGGEYNPYDGYTRKGGRSRSHSADSVRSTTSNQEQKVVIDRAAQQNLRAARALWDLIPHPEYADEDDGIDKLMTKEALYYAIQGQVFVGEAY